MSQRAPAFHGRTLLLLIALVTVGLAIPLILGGEQAYRLVLNLPMMAFLKLLAAMAIVWNLNLIRLLLLLDGQSHELGYWRMFRIYLATEFVSKTTPAGSGAPFAAVSLLSRHGVRPATCLAVFGVAACMDAVILALCITAFVVAGFTSLLGDNIALSVVVLAAVMGLIIGSSYLLFARHKLLITVADIILKSVRIQDARRRKVKRLVTSLHRALTNIARLPPWRLAMSWGAGLLYWVIYLSTLYMTVVALGGMISWGEAGFIQMIAMGIGHMLMVPGGAGGTEISGALLLNPLLGVTLTASVILVWRFLMLHLYLMAGGLSLLSLLPPLRHRGNGSYHDHHN